MNWPWIIDHNNHNSYESVFPLSLVCTYMCPYMYVCVYTNAFCLYCVCMCWLWPLLFVKWLFIVFTNNYLTWGHTEHMHMRSPSLLLSPRSSSSPSSACLSITLLIPPSPRLANTVVAFQQCPCQSICIVARCCHCGARQRPPVCGITQLDGGGRQGHVGPPGCTRTLNLTRPVHSATTGRVCVHVCESWACKQQTKSKVYSWQFTLTHWPDEHFSSLFLLQLQWKLWWCDGNKICHIL